jgi:glutamyl-tRNA synthetase
MSVRTRFAPSPTGVLHIGSVRTALFCWLYARHHGGQYILRIEDTDRERSTEENLAAILDGMSWLGIDSDEGPYYQSQRTDRYREVLDQWLAGGQAYHCYCTKGELAERREAQIANGENPRYDGRCRAGSEPRPGVDPVVRFRNPQEGNVVVQDRVRGEVIFDNAELDDLIIARSDGSPTYNFTVVVDDADMRISHVIRGDDHLNNTPRQLNMIAALGVDVPSYAHLPMILGEDGAKLSKRHGAVDVREYRDSGYFPEALLNYLVRLGWSHGDQEIFSEEEMIRLFDIDDVNQSASAFNAQKLKWLNQQYIIATPSETLGERLQPFLISKGYDLSSGPTAAQVAAAFHERAETLTEMAASAWYCFQDFEAFDAGAAKKHLRPVILDALVAFRGLLDETTEWTRENLGRQVSECAEAQQINMGKLGQPIRVAITGGPVSPPIDVTLELVGRDRVIRRIDQAIGFIRQRAASNP